MPYWQIFTPANAFTHEDREQLSQAITSIYVDYVEPPAVLRGRPVQRHAEEHHVRRRESEQQLRPDLHRPRRATDGHRGAARACMTAIEDKLAPFVKERGYDWEVHIDETPIDLWRTQGLVPPPPYSDIEKLWATENRPIPYELAAS